MPTKEEAGEKLMSLAELARFLHVGQKTVLKLAREDKLPSSHVGSEWRFSRSEIDEWLAKQLHDEEVDDFSEMTDGMRLPLGDLLPDESVIHDMRARDAIGAIEELAARAWGNNWLNDKPWFVGALVEREALASTAMEGGVAFLHTRARDTGKISRPFIIVGRSYEGVDFGAPDGKPTFLFFLLGLKYDKLHLPILGRLARIMVRDVQTIGQLRATTSPSKMRNILLTLDAEELKNVAPGHSRSRTSQPVMDRDTRLRAIMRVQAQRRHRAEKEAEADRKAKLEAKKVEAAAKKKADAAARKEARLEAAAKKKAQAAAKRKARAEAAAKKKAEAAAKKKARAAAARKKKAEAAAKKKARAAAAKKKKAAAAKKKKAKASTAKKKAKASGAKKKAKASGARKKKADAKKKAGARAKKKGSSRSKKK